MIHHSRQVDDIVEQLKGLTLTEAAELVKAGLLRGAETGETKGGSWLVNDYWWFGNDG